MAMISDFLEKNSQSPKENPSQTWNVRPAKPSTSSRPLLRRLFKREDPSLFQRCLAVHIHFAGPHGGLS
jgi:hypothetical protein